MNRTLKNKRPPRLDILGGRLREVRQYFTSKGIIVTCSYLSTLPVFAGVFKFFIKSPSLLVRAPNLPGNTYRGFFKLFSLTERRLQHSEGLRMIFGEYSDIADNDIVTMQRILDVSRFLYSGSWQVCMFIVN